MQPFMDNDASHKELFDMGYPWAWTSEEQRKYPLVEETPFPTSEKLVWIREAYEKHYMLFHNLSMKLI